MPASLDILFSIMNSTLQTFNGTEDVAALESFLILPEVVNLFFLSGGVYGMYQGIQISHPIYAVLFLNLVIQLATSIMSLVAFQLMKAVYYVRLANANSSLSLLFHCSAWCFTSVMRFIYITRSEWVHSKFQNPKVLCSLSIISVFAVNVVFMSPVFIMAVLLGYPRVTIMETGFRNVVILILSLVSSYLLPIAISCTVYIALLVVKKRIGQNKINVVEQANLEPHDSSDGPTFYAVQMQQNETSERNNQPTSKEDVSNVLNDADADDVLRVQAEERRQAEIRAATRSIETNLVLVVIFVVVYGAFIFMSGKVRQSYSLFAFSTLKGLLPICTTIANFGTVHSVMIQYCQYFKSKFCRHDLE